MKISYRIQNSNAVEDAFEPLPEIAVDEDELPPLSIRSVNHMGHLFGDTLACRRKRINPGTVGERFTLCGREWEHHQVAPNPCPFHPAALGES